MAFVRHGLAPALLLIAAAGLGISVPASAATDATDAPTDDIEPSGEVIAIANEGGALEGHTPTAFAGMGTGLFVGDNLNPGFPEGVGVQTYLTFVLPTELDASGAQLVSDVLRVSGTPFEDLGPLLVEPIAYESFGPELFDLVAIGSPTECTITGETSIECDVSEALQAVVAEGRAVAQFRIRFEAPADNDGSQDLAMFFRTDSNTNEPGLFELLIAQGAQAIPE